MVKTCVERSGKNVNSNVDKMVNRQLARLHNFFKLEEIVLYKLWITTNNNGIVTEIQHMSSCTVSVFSVVYSENLEDCMLFFDCGTV